MAQVVPHTHTRRIRVAAWGVHLYTALGLPLMFFAAIELVRNFEMDSGYKDPRLFFLLIWIAVLVDSTDGFLARTIRVKEVLPTFSGRRLDDLVDFLSFVFLPCLALPALDLLPDGWEALAIVPIMASGYGFCQEKAKTDDAFVGFPSYWNVVLLYLFLLSSSPWVNVAIILVLSVLVFVPIHYIYPSRTKLMMPLTLVLASFWGGALFAVSLWPYEPWTLTVSVISLAFPLYYVGLSLVHHQRTHRQFSTHS